MFTVTREMIVAFAKFFSIDLTDGSQEPGVIGSINNIAAGHSNGHKLAFLFDAPENRETFAPLRKAFFEAQGFPEPAYSNVHADQSVAGEGQSA